MDEDTELAAIRERKRAQLFAPQVPAHPIDIDDALLPAFARENPVAVVDVWAPWCGPCRIVGPIVDALAQEMAGRVAFAKLNADDNPGTMHAFGIMGIPTLLVFRDGKLADRIVGALPKAQLKAAIERHAAN